MVFHPCHAYIFRKLKCITWLYSDAVPSLICHYCLLHNHTFQGMWMNSRGGCRFGWSRTLEERGISCHPWTRMHFFGRVFVLVLPQGILLFQGAFGIVKPTIKGIKILVWAKHKIYWRGKLTNLARACWILARRSGLVFFPFWWDNSLKLLSHLKKVPRLMATDMSPLLKIACAHGKTYIRKCSSLPSSAQNNFFFLKKKTLK